MAERRQEELSIRDRYMIGDWVLKDGKPYKWEASDYNRSAFNMVTIKPMPLTIEILKANNFERTYEYYDKDAGWRLTIGSGSCNMSRVTIDVFPSVINLDICRRAEQRNGDYRDGVVSFRYQGDVSYVYELQHALKCCWLDELADNLRLI